MTEPTAVLDPTLDPLAALRLQMADWAARQRAYPTIYLDCDLVAELRRFWRLPALQRWPGSPVPPLRVRYSSVKHGPKSVSGVAMGSQHRIVLTIGCGAQLSSVLETLLHEAVHLSLPGESHGERFILRVVRAATEAWGVDIPKPLETTDRGYHRKLAYAVDHRIVVELQRVFDAGCGLPPKAETPPPTPKPSRVERTGQLRRERQEHAIEMLKKTERKLKIAQRRARVWREKVRYYEKVAAKRGGTP